MLQRTPTWYFIRPAKDGIANFLRKIPARGARVQDHPLQECPAAGHCLPPRAAKPEKVKEFLTKKLQASLGDRYDAKAFTPPYNPWDQRLCLVPDADFFEAMKADKASVVTDHIEKFDATGIQLKSGQHLDADIIITATGLKLAVAGKIPVRVDGAAVDWHDHFYYKACMFSKRAELLGRVRLSQRKLDAACRYRVRICLPRAQPYARYRNHRRNPALADPSSLEEENVFDFSSGYIQRSLHIMPKSTVALPWRLSQNYVQDRIDMRTGAIADGVLTFGNASRGGYGARRARSRGVTVRRRVSRAAAGSAKKPARRLRAARSGR